MQPAVWRKCADHRIPIKRHVDGADQKVEAASEFVDRLRIPARHDVIRSETLRFVELALAGREGGHIAAVRGGELHGHVPKPADADDAHPVGRLGMHHERREDGDAAAQQRTRVGKVQLSGSGMPTPSARARARRTRRDAR